MAWLEPKARQLPTGTRLDKERCQQLGLPLLSVQNAQSCATKFLSGRILDSQTGHVACKLKLKAQVLMMFDLRREMREIAPWERGYILRSIDIQKRVVRCMCKTSLRKIDYYICIKYMYYHIYIASVFAHVHLSLAVCRYFPWDEQSLFVILMLASLEDRHRHLVLEKLTCEDAVKAGEWAQVATFAKGYTTGGNSKAVFGLLIKRRSF